MQRNRDRLPAASSGLAYSRRRWLRKEFANLDVDDATCLIDGIVQHQRCDGDRPDLEASAGSA
jgi:hypothetical protein